MWRLLMGVIEARAQALTQRLAVPTLLILIASSLLMIAICALFIALFLYLVPMLGPIGSALGVAAAALVMGALALLPLRRSRRPPPAPSAAAPTGVDFASLLPLISNIVKTRPLVFGALLVALVLALTSKSNDDDPNG
jgi:Na+-driven multidrug efflux pump